MICFERLAGSEFKVAVGGVSDVIASSPSSAWVFAAGSPPARVPEPASLFVLSLAVLRAVQAELHQCRH